MESLRTGQSGPSAISWAHEKLLIFYVKNDYFHDVIFAFCQVIVNTKYHFLHELSVIFRETMILLRALTAPSLMTQDNSIDPKVVCIWKYAMVSFHHSKPINNECIHVLDCLLLLLLLMVVLQLLHTNNYSFCVCIDSRWLIQPETYYVHQNLISLPVDQTWVLFQINYL